VSNNHLANQSETQHESDSMKWQSKTPMTVRQAADTFLAEHFPVGFRQLSQLNVTLNAGIYTGTFEAGSLRAVFLIESDAAGLWTIERFVG